MKIVLASSSPRRKEILSRLNVDFEIINPGIDEPKYLDDELPEKYSEKLSKIKACSVSEKLSELSIIIGADTIVVLDKNIVLGKPADRDEAYKTLKMLSGKAHSVITAVTIINKFENQTYTFHEKTLVKFLNLRDNEILKYIDTKSPYDKAGSYGIQDYSSIFVEKINGCYDNVLGFPLSKFNYVCKNILNIAI